SRRRHTRFSRDWSSDVCSSDLRFGKFFGCTNASCKNTRKLLKSGEAAPPKIDPIRMPELKCEKVDDIYVLRDGASGLFLAASQRSEERRVGKECRSRRSREQRK